MGAAILTFAAVFILLTGIGSVLFYRRSIHRRLAGAVAEPSAFILDAPPPCSPARKWPELSSRSSGCCRKALPRFRWCRSV
jgi:hypothetical protein